MMFEGEMSSLGLPGLDLGPLFPEGEDLLFGSLPLDLQQEQLQQQQQGEEGKEQQDDETPAEQQQQVHLPQQQQQDLLQKVIDEIKMAPIEIMDEQVKIEQDQEQQQRSLATASNSEMKTFLADYDDLMFDDDVLASAAASVEAKEVDDDHTQDLIDEMEEFLSSHEQQNNNRTAVEEVPMDQSSSSSSSDPLLTAEEAEQAEQIVEALVSGDLTLDSYSQERQMQLASDPQLGIPGGAAAIGATISNISEIVTEDGNRIVIVIANDKDAAAGVVPASYNGNVAAQVVPGSPAASTSYAASSPASSTATNEDDGDSDWTPDSPPASARAAKTTRAAAPAKTKRGPYKAPTSNVSKRYNVKDKKERKKLQNVVAARRYRDKKKSEQAELEEEEQQLEERNRQLTGRLAEMDNEVRTLKKLMVELGLVKVSAATARSLNVKVKA